MSYKSPVISYKSPVISDELHIMHELCEKNDFENIVLHIKQYPRLTYDAFITACRYGHLETVKYLVANNRENILMFLAIMHLLVQQDI